MVYGEEIKYKIDYFVIDLLIYLMQQCISPKFMFDKIFLHFGHFVEMTCRFELKRHDVTQSAYNKIYFVVKDRVNEE